MGVAPVEGPGGLPDHFGKYSILGHLATGGMAEVYLARAGGIEGFEKIVVIKRIRPELMGDQTTTSFFLDEARLVATLEHPNIAQVYEIGQVTGNYFFVMEYVHGADLRQLLTAALRKKHQISLADAIYIITHVCAALHYAHEKRSLSGESLDIIHRDISPSNVLISHDGAVKVCDFGIARAQNRQTETERGVLKGKFAYMSPEQCKSETIDRRSDIFALGILLFELSTMSRLFAAESEFLVLRKIVDEPIPLPSTRVSTYPSELERIVMKALARNPADRYATAQEMQLALEAFARERRLAMSSVNIAKLMGSLFEKRVEAWMRAQKAGSGLADHLMDTAVKNSRELPVLDPLGFGAAGSGDLEDPDITVEGNETVADSRRRKSDPVMAAGSNRRRTQPIAVQAEPIPTTPPPAPAPATRRPSALWLVGALVGGLAAGGATVIASMSTNADRNAVVAQLDSDAERIVTAIDTSARTAYSRAETLAAAPVLRTAIETDVQTIKDVVLNEMALNPRSGEIVEIFQLKNGKPTLVLQLPEGAKAPPASDATSMPYVAGDTLAIRTSANVAGYKNRKAGTVVISETVDLASARRYLTDHTQGAALSGMESDFKLVATTGKAEPRRVPLTTSADWGSKPLTLVAVPRVAAAVAWLVPAQYAGVGLAGLLVLIYVAGMLRARSMRA